MRGVGDVDAQAVSVVRHPPHPGVLDHFRAGEDLQERALETAVGLGASRRPAGVSQTMSSAM
jgi:hypothetical protein